MGLSKVTSPELCFSAQYPPETFFLYFSEAITFFFQMEVESSSIQVEEAGMEAAEQDVAIEIKR